MKNFFFPTLQNRLKPYSLRFMTLGAVVCLLLLIEVLFYMYVNMEISSRLAATENTTSSAAMVTDRLGEVLTSTRVMASTTLLALLVYVLIVLIIPMIVIFISHRSANLKLRVREIQMLFKESIHMATRVIIIIVLMYLCNYVLFNPLTGPISDNLKFVN